MATGAVRVMVYPPAGRAARKAEVLRAAKGALAALPDAPPLQRVPWWDPRMMPVAPARPQPAVRSQPAVATGVPAREKPEGAARWMWTEQGAADRRSAAAADCRANPRQWR